MKKSQFNGFLFFDFSLSFLLLLLIFMSFIHHSGSFAISSKNKAESYSLLRKVSDASDYLVKSALVTEGAGYRLSHEISQKKLSNPKPIEKSLSKKLNLSYLEIYIGNSQPPTTNAHRICVTRAILIEKQIGTIIICGG